MRKSTFVERFAGLDDVFTIDDVRANTNMSEDALKKFIYRLEKNGWIERIEKGKYMLLPLGAEKEKYTLHEFIVGSMLIEPYCIAYWSALHHHGLTEQIPSTVFIQTTSRKKHQRLEIFGVDYRIIRLIRKKFFGIVKERINNNAVAITDREKTIVDCLDKPQHCGGVVEVIKGLNEKEYDPARLVDYAKRIGNTGVVRRLGFLNDYYGLDIEVPPLDSSIRNYLLLDPVMPDEGQKNSKWRLIINMGERDLEEVR